MSQDLLGYNEMVERAMRSVVRQALNHAADQGLPGNHHFYVTFSTDHPDVVLPETLRQQYPHEMTIVLQHQFWGLETDEDGFEVTLSFNKRQERLRIPFEALMTFADPSVNFGLQFHVDPADEDDVDDRAAPHAAESAKGTGQDLDEVADGEMLEGEEDPDADNIVTLDTFRKK